MYRYNICLIAALFICGSIIYAQPKLKKITGQSDLPDLSVDSILNIEDLLVFNNDEGIILYHEDRDSWVLYDHLVGYEEFGRIIDLKKMGEIFLFSLEKKGIIITNDYQITIDYSFLEAFSIDKKIVSLCSNISELPTGYYNSNRYNNSYKTATTLLTFNIKKKTIDTIHLKKPIIGIRTCTFHQNHFWVTILQDQGEYWHQNLYKIDLRGNIADKSLDENFGGIMDVHSNDESLYLFANDHYFTLFENDTVIHSFQFPNPFKHMLRFDGDILYFLNKYQGHGEKLRLLRYKIGDANCDTILINNHDGTWPIYHFQVNESFMFSLPENINRVDRFHIDDQGLQTHYVIREGLNDHIDNMVEDEHEIWYISNKSGLVRFTKKDSTWKNYPISLDILGDSINTLHFKELTINEDYVFIPLSDNTSMTHGFVLLDRNTEELQYFSDEEFREAFFYYEGQFATYKNTTFARDRYNDTLFSFFRQLPEHHALIQLYELPTSGSYVWNMRYKTISKDDYFITSSIILDYPPTWFKGVLIKYADKRIKIVEFPHFVKNFSGSVLPYLISGDEFEIYVASQGRDDKGFFIYHVLDEEIESDPLWGETVGHISFIIDVGKYVIIGSYNKKLYSFNKSTKQITDISEHISTFPKYCEMSAKFIYIGTNKELIYFDKDMNYCGKLHDGESTLHNTDYGLYLNTKHEVYILID